MGPRGAMHRPRGVAHGPQGVANGPLGPMASPLKVLLAPHNVPGTPTLRPKFSSLGGFWAPPTKTSYTTPYYYPKYEV